MTPYGGKDLGHHRFRQWFVTSRHQAITWTNVVFSLMKFYCIHMRTISPLVSKLLFFTSSLKCILTKLPPNIPVANELNGASDDLWAIYFPIFPWQFILVTTYFAQYSLLLWYHYTDVIMGEIASQITSLTIVYSDADQRKHQCSASLVFVWGIHRGPVNSPHKWPVTRKMFPFDDVIMACFVTVFQNENNNGTANLIIMKNNIQCVAGTEKSAISFVFIIWDTFY